MGIIPGGRNINNGYYDVSNSDLTPIVYSPNTPIKLTNDGTGSFSSSSPALGVSRVWNSQSNSIDFSEIPFGDAITVRLDININNVDASSNVESYIDFGSFTIPLKFVSDVPSGNYRFLGSEIFYVGDVPKSTGSADIMFKSSSSGSLVVNGFLFQLIRNS